MGCGVVVDYCLSDGHHNKFVEVDVGRAANVDAASLRDSSTTMRLVTLAIHSQRALKPQYRCSNAYLQSICLLQLDKQPQHALSDTYTRAMSIILVPHA